MKISINQGKNKAENGSCVIFNYSGTSMNPTFQAGDGLTVLPYRNRKARPGDVVVFNHPEKATNIVHRIVRIDFQGITTRGDNSICDDQWILKPENIIGRVISAKRARRNLKISGGRTGIVVAGIQRLKKRIGSMISKSLHPHYSRLSGSGIFHGWLSHFMEMKLLYFKKPRGTEIQLLMGKWIIGKYVPQKDFWIIKRPFRIFIDTSALPKGGQSMQSKTKTGENRLWEAET